MANYKPTEGETIYDVSVKLYGDMTLGLNELLTTNNITLDTDIVGLNLTYDETATRPFPRQPLVKIVGTKGSYKSQENQSVYDLSIQLYGSIEAGLPVLLSKGFALNQYVPTLTPIEYDPGKEARFSVAGTDIPPVPTISYRYRFDALVAIDSLFANATMTTGMVEALSAYDQSTYQVTGVANHGEEITATVETDRYVIYDTALTEAITASNSQDRFVEWGAISSEAISSTSSQDRFIDAFGTQSEALSATNAQDRTLIMPVDRSEAISATTSHTATFDGVSSMEESVTITGVPNATYVLGLASSTENASATASQANTLVAPVSITEALTASHTQSNTIIIGVTSITEPASPSESQVATVNFSVVSMTEALTLTVVQDNYVIYTVIDITEAIFATSSQDRTYTLGTVAITEALTSSDASDRTSTLGTASATEALSASHSDSCQAVFQNNQGAFNGAPWDTSDAGGSIFNVSHTEGITATDSPSGANSSSTSISNGITATESQSALQVSSRSASESASATNSQDATHIDYAVSLDTTYVQGIDSNQVGVWIDSGSVTATVTGGRSWIIYEWQFVSGDSGIAVSDSTASTVTFGATVDCGNIPREAVWRCKIYECGECGNPNDRIVIYSDNVSIYLNNTETTCG
jgi:hypothetical protein